MKTIKETIHAQGIEIGIYTTDFENEFISLTDIARYRSSDPRITIHSWLRSRDIVEFLGLWECLHNPDFKRSEFDTFKTDAGTNAFTFSIKNWNEQLCGKGIITKSGRYGGTDATPALTHSLEMLQRNAYKNADVLMISDFVMDTLPTDLVNSIEEEKNNNTCFYSLVIGSSGNQNTIKAFNHNWIYDTTNSNASRHLVEQLHEIKMR